MNKIKYIGCFFDREQLQEALKPLERTPLQRPIAQPHITVVYRPREIPVALFGLKVTAKVTGYGCDGENEALQVELIDPPQGLRQLVEKIPVPHITLSVSADGEPVNSSRLDFQRVAPFFLEGVFGAMTNADKVITSYEE